MIHPTPTPNIDEPRLWRLYMLIGRGGIDVMLFHSSDASGIELFTFPYDSDDGKLTHKVEEVVYANPWLVNDFGRVSVLVDTPHYRILPAELADSEGLIPAQGEEVLRSQAGAVESMDFAVESSLAGFIRRTWPTATVEHRLAPLSRYFYSKSRIGTPGKMYAHVGDKTLDLIAYGRNGLLMLNTFEFVEPVDAVYYIMACRELLGLDNINGELIIAGASDVRDTLTDTLRTYIAGVMPSIFPASIYGASRESADAPFPLIVMPLCE